MCAPGKVACHDGKTWVQLGQLNDDGNAHRSAEEFCSALFALAAGRGGAGGLLGYPEPLGVTAQPGSGGQDFRLDLAAGIAQSASVSRHLSLPLAAGGASSARAECIFRGVRGDDAWLAGAVGRAVAARPHGRATPARTQRLFISDDGQRVAAAGFGGGGLRPATDVLGARDEFHG